MIKQFFVTGDTHGCMDRFVWLEIPNPKETGIIILGDAGVNFYQSAARRHDIKMQLEQYGCTFYLVRGNHEARPEDVKGIEEVWDDDVANYVFIEPGYPHIHYLMDGSNYDFLGHNTLVIGGAYSVDKWYRLENHYTWYSNEQLTETEMQAIETTYAGQSFDFVFTHTCPLSWEPTDLFLSMIDQSTVDDSMEVWLDSFKDKINWGVWLFGHFHADRMERPHVEQYFKAIEDLEEIWKRWNDPNYLVPTYFRKSPNFNKGKTE